MKKYIYILSIFTALFYSCSENDRIEFPDEESAIYFQLSEEYGKKDLDSLSYSFAFNDKVADTVSLQVKIMGNTMPHDRFFKIELIDSLTTAIQEKHYDVLESQYVIPADSIYGQVPVVIYNTDTLLKDSTFRMTFRLLESEDYSLGYENRLIAKLLFTNQLVEPGTWRVLKYFFGTYNRTKHKVFYQLYEREFPEDIYDIYGEYGLWQTYGKLTSQYFSDNYPVYDENGEIVEPW